MTEFTFITGNPKKAEQLSRYLNFLVKHRALDLPEIQSMDVEEIAAEKAKTAYEIVKSPVIVEDTSLALNAMNGLPGPLIKWFLESMGNEGLCQLASLNGSRGAIAKTCIALCTGYETKLFIGERKGLIAIEPRGETDFGWNPIFIPEGSTRTWAEMNLDEQRETSMRRLAVEKLQAYLEENHKSA